MIRIACFICVLLVSLSLSPEASFGQVPREVPEPSRLNTLPPNQRMRIPDPLVRHGQLPDKVRSGEYVQLSVIRKIISERYPGKIVNVNLLRARREGLQNLYDVRVLTEAGKVLSIKFDAKTAEIVDVKG